MNAYKEYSLAFIILLTSCATTPREKIIQNIIIASAAGFIVGASRDQNKLANGLMYGGIGGSAAGLATALLSNIDSDQTNLKTENLKLKEELDRIYSPQIVHETNGLLNSKIPNKYKSMINPGEWKVYALDQWVEDNENKLIHQDKMMELIPPSLTPAQLPIINRKDKDEK